MPLASRSNGSAGLPASGTKITSFVAAWKGPTGMIAPSTFPLFAVAALVLIAATTDVLWFRVPNAITLPAIAAGLVAAGWSGGWSGLGAGLAGFAAGLLVLAFFFALGGVGAGDVKLFAAIGAWLGPAAMLQVFAASALLAGVYALALSVIGLGVGVTGVRLVALGQQMARPREWSRPAARIGDEVARPDRRRRLVPFAATTCLGFGLMLAVWAYQGDRLALPAGPARVPVVVAALEAEAR